MFLQDHQLAALIVFMVASFGMTCNWTIVCFIRRLPSLQNPFGRLLASQALGEAIHLSIFTFFFCPMVFFDVHSMMSISRHFGHVLLICYDICIYCHLFISLNRFSAIFFPTKYERIYSKEHTTVMIVLSWIVAIVPSFYFYVWEDCHFYYMGDFWHFVFSNNPICNFITWYTDFMKYVSIVILIVAIDVITVIRVHAVNSRSLRYGGGQNNSRRADEINFLKQACLQAGVFVCELITYFVLVAYFENLWVKFFLSTVAWVLVHTLDGVITLSFNREFRLLIQRKLNTAKDIVGMSTGSRQIHAANTTGSVASNSRH